MVVTYEQVGATLLAASFMPQPWRQMWFHIRTFHICISRYSLTQYAIGRRYWYFSTVSPGHLTRLNIIKTKTGCVDYYYSSLLLTIIHSVDLSSQSGVLCTLLPRLWSSVVIQVDQNSFDVLNQAFNTCSLRFKGRFFVSYIPRM